MRLFVDSGSIEAIRKLMKYYNISGVTTNPKIATQVEIENIVEEFQLPTSLQIDVRNSEAAIHLATKKYLENALYNIKVPISHPNIGKVLIERGIQVNFTLCFRLAHVITAVNLSARYVSIFIGRMLDNFEDAYELVRASRKYIDSIQSKTEIIAASIRNADHIELACKAGAHIVTASPDTFISALEHDLTNSGLRDFEQHFQKNLDL
jgi:transaldolase